MYAADVDLPVLRALFDAQRIEMPMKFLVLRRRKHWAIELPVGTFVNEFRPGVAAYAEDVRARDEAFSAFKTTFGPSHYDQRTLVIQHEGSTYLHQHAINALRRVIPHPAFLNAVAAFLRAAEAKPELVKGPRTSRRPFVPPAQRRAALGYPTRGPSWTSEEDTILRQWFGKRTTGDLAGQHAPLSKEQWDRVLELLGGRRTVMSVRRRIFDLNETLKRELCVDGYVPRDRLRAYMDRALGEKPRRPRLSPQRRRPRAAPRPQQAAAL